jgi:hypothetical protein
VPLRAFSRRNSKARWRYFPVAAAHTDLAVRGRFALFSDAMSDFDCFLRVSK